MAPNAVKKIVLLDYGGLTIREAADEVQLRILNAHTISIARDTPSEATAIEIVLV